MVCFQLFLVHLAGVGGQQLVQPHRLSSQVIDSTQVRGTDHIIVLAPGHVAHKAVQLAAVQERACCASHIQVGVPLQ